MSTAQIMQKVKEIGIPLVELTGGEPLAQEGCVKLADTLLAEGYKVLIETSGSEDVSRLAKEVHIIMDLKAPGSKMEHKNRMENLTHLKPTDEIKMVLADRDDFVWAKNTISKYKLSERFNVLLSCAFGLLNPKDLAEWILEAKLNVRLNLQQHKYIWHPRTKGV
jgi:7-carboxy-7-deazaguanine synthase